LNIYCYGRFW